MAVALGLLALVATGRLPSVFALEGGLLLFGWLGVGLLASVISAPATLVSLRTLVLIAAGALTATLISYLGRRTNRDVIGLYLDVWFLAILIGVLGTGFDIVTGHEAFTDTLTDIVTYRRARGTFYEPNFYGISSMMLAIILLDLLVTQRGRANRWASWRFIVCVVAVVLSGTRSAQLAFLGGAMLLLMVRGKTKTGIVLVGLAAVCALIVVPLIATGLIHTAFTDRLIGTFLSPEASSSIVGRLEMARQALEQVPGYLWLGHGTNAYGQFNPLLDAIGEPVYGRRGMYLSSLPVSVLYDTGIVGLALWFGWLVKHHLAAFYFAGRHGSPGLLWGFVCSSLLMFSTFITSDATLQSFPWVHIGMTLVLVHKVRTGVRSTNGWLDIPSLGNSGLANSGREASQT
ncbi:MAG: O-antigen ligase family protein [Chloroflexota bacterium]